MNSARAAISYLQALPLVLIFVVFFLAPLAIVVIVSFFDYQAYDVLIPDFTTFNYSDVFTANVTYQTYLITAKFSLVVWAITLVLGFFVAYFLAFCVRSVPLQIALFLMCTIPFWTSIVIRSISWIPLLGLNGLINKFLINAGIIDAPLEWLLFSEFAVVVGYVHLFTLFMIVPIFNSMMRIDKSLLEAAEDAGASFWQTIWTVVLPLTKPGIAIGSIFVVAMVMGDFVTVNVLGGGQVASIGKLIATELSYLQFPPAAANAMTLLGVVILLIFGLMRIVDVRREL